MISSLEHAAVDHGILERVLAPCLTNSGPICFTETLTATGIPSPWHCQAAICAHASCTTHAPTPSISPDSSRIQMNSFGMTSPARAAASE